MALMVQLDNILFTTLEFMPRLFLLLPADQLAGAMLGASAGAAQIKDASGTVSESITGKGEWALFIILGWGLARVLWAEMSDVGM